MSERPEVTENGRRVMERNSAGRKRIETGTLVRWRSTSNGSQTVKEGVVLALLPPRPSDDGNALVVLRRLRGDVPASRLRVQPSTYASSVDRYLVEVGRYYYAPRAGVVERQNPAALTTEQQA